MHTIQYILNIFNFYPKVILLYIALITVDLVAGVSSYSLLKGSCTHSLCSTDQKANANAKNNVQNILVTRLPCYLALTHLVKFY